MSATATEVRFPSGAVTLAGTLHLPTGPGPHPAIVMLQGSGPADRDNAGYFPPIREQLVGAGFAVLGYDKPGVGGSTGDWHSQTIHDLAEHALKALAVLREHASVDAARVGLWGHSEGGYVVPLAASCSSEVAFAVAQSCPGIPPVQQVIYAIEQELRQDGRSVDDIERSTSTARALLDAARAWHDFAAVEARILRPARHEPWFAALGIGDAGDWTFVRGMVAAAYDPAEALARVTCPLLAIFGELDRLLPIEASVTIFEHALAKAGNRDLTIRVFPGANHRIKLEPSGAFAPDYLESMLDWLHRQIG